MTIEKDGVTIPRKWIRKGLWALVPVVVSLLGGIVDDYRAMDVRVNRLEDQVAYLSLPDSLVGPAAPPEREKGVLRKLVHFLF